MLICAWGGYSISSYAVTSCISCGSVTNSITANLSAGENSVGTTKASNDVMSSAGTYSKSPNQEVQWWGGYPGSGVSQPNTAVITWNYHKIDEYISVALSVEHPECNRQFYMPFNVKLLNNGDCQAAVNPNTQATFSPVSFKSRIRIDKKLVSGTYSKNILVAESGVCQPANCQSKQAIISRIYLNLNITVPQTCTLNPGQVINIDFGNLSSGAFTVAGARPEGVNDIIRTIPIECNGIAANTAMTVRLQADKVSGNAVVTNTNNDVGFVVADGNGTALTPNNLSSVIPFSLGSDNKSSVTIRVYPVSVTGNKPAEGPVTSQAYLRVDFA